MLRLANELGAGTPRQKTLNVLAEPELVNAAKRFEKKVPRLNRRISS